MHSAAGVIPDDGDLVPEDITLTQGDKVAETNPEEFDLSKFCKTLAAATDLNDSDPYRRSNLSDYIAKNEVGEDFTVLTVQHDKYDAVQYVILYEKVDMGSNGTCYHGHYCTCGYLVTSGVPCRHFWAVHKRIGSAAFSLGQVHKRWMTTNPEADYELVTHDGVIGTTERINPVVARTTSVINPLTQQLTEQQGELPPEGQGRVGSGSSICFDSAGRRSGVRCGARSLSLTGWPTSTSDPTTCC